MRPSCCVKKPEVITSLLDISIHPCWQGATQITMSAWGNKRGKPARFSFVPTFEGTFSSPPTSQGASIIGIFVMDPIKMIVRLTRADRSMKILTGFKCVRGKQRLPKENGTCAMCLPGLNEKSETWWETHKRFKKGKDRLFFFFFFYDGILLADFFQ